MSLFQKIFQQYLKRFFVTMGREPQTPAEWMQIQDDAVRYLNKTKGAPSIKKDPFQGFDPKIVGKEEKITIDEVLKGPVRSKGPKGDRIWDLSQKKGEVIPFPDKGIGSLIKKGDVTVGTAPKTLPETLKTKKDRGILLRDADEDILRIKRENKQAVEDFKKKFHPKEPDKFQFGGIAPLVGEPSYSADFYDDRTPYKVGKIVKGLKELLKKKPKSNKLSEQDVAALKKKHGLDPESLKKDDEAFKLRLQQILAKHSTKHAEGGRIGLAGGGALFKFIEKLFIKASNDIRLGRGKWKGLDQKQRIVQHDNLTKKVTEFQKTGKL
jgi:hypothetical protein